MTEYQDIPSSLCAPQFPSALSSTVQDSVSHLTQDDFQSLHDLLFEQRREISAKIGTVRDIMTHLSRAKARVDKALQEMIYISKQRRRKNREDHKQRRISPYPVSSGLPVRSLGHQVGKHLDIDVTMGDASIPSSHVPSSFPCDRSPTSNNGNASSCPAPTSSSPAAEPQTLSNTLPTPQSATRLATEVQAATSTYPVGAHTITPQLAYTFPAISPAYDNPSDEKFVATTSPDTDHKPVIHLSDLTKKWRNWKVAEMKGASLPVDKTQYRVAKSSDYERMDPIALFKKLVIKKKKPAVVELATEPDIDNRYGVRRGKKTSSRHDPMQKSARGKPTTFQILRTEGRRLFDPNGVEVSSLLELILLDEKLKDLTKSLGDLELQGPI